MNNKKSSRDKLVNRINKLLEISYENGASDNEVKVALMKAQELMIKHKISEDELVPDEDKEPIITQSCEKSGCNTKLLYFLWLSTVIADNFRCKVYQKLNPNYDYSDYVLNKKKNRFEYKRKGRYTPVFVGRESDVTLACIAFIYAYNSAWYGLRRYAKSEGKRLVDVRHDYYTGFVSGLKECFTKQITEMKYELAVIPDEDVSKFYDNELNLISFKASNNSNNDIDAFNKGLEDGIEFNTDPVLGDQVSSDNPESEDEVDE